MHYIRITIEPRGRFLHLVVSVCGTSCQIKLWHLIPATHSSRFFTTSWSQNSMNSQVSFAYTEICVDCSHNLSPSYLSYIVFKSPNINFHRLLQTVKGPKFSRFCPLSLLFPNNSTNGCRTRTPCYPI